MLSIEYIAGFIDGEGSFGIYPKQTRMTVTNLNRGILLEIKERIGAGRIVERSTGVHQYECGGGALREFLPQLIPHLHVKRLLAELLLEYLTPIPIRNEGGVRDAASGRYTRARPVPAHELLRRECLRRQVCAINRSRGRLAWGSARAV